MHNENFLNLISGEIRLRRFALIKLVALLAAVMMCAALDASAQTKRPIKKRGGAKTVAIFKKENPQNAEQFVKTASVPVTVLNSAETDYLSGEASVAVNPKQPTVVRLGLAQNAVSVVEFPASDGIYYIHEGNPKFASVFQSPTRETDRSITIYPGETFVAGSANGANPSATITLQMRSGLILILEFVPVGSLSRNAHRCVINYNRDEIINARRTAGLAYNLGDDVKPNNAKTTRAISRLVGGATDEFLDSQLDETNNTNPTVRLASLEVSKGKVSRKENEKPNTKKPKTALEISRLVNKRLAECLKNPAKNFGAFYSASYGLTMAVSSAGEIDAEQRLIVVAVRNETTGNLRLVPGTPELEIQTIDEKGNALQTERLDRSYIETTSLEGLITASSTVYYAIVYRAPVMGASQRLKVLVSHREAADSPVTVSVPNATADAKKE